MPPMSQLPGLAGTREAEMNVQPHIWLPTTEKAARIGVPCLGLYPLRQKAGQGQGCGFSHSLWALLWLSWLLLSDLEKGVASHTFVGICHLRSEGHFAWSCVCARMCVHVPHPPTRCTHMQETLSMLDFKSLWLESWPFPITNHPVTCRGNGVTVMGLDRWRFLQYPAGHGCVVSESFPLLHYMHLIIHGVFCRIPHSQPPSFWHSMGTASLELVGTTCVYLTPWAVVSLLPHDGVGVWVLLCDCFSFFISSLSFYYSFRHNQTCSSIRIPTLSHCPPHGIITKIKCLSVGQAPSGSLLCPLDIYERLHFYSCLSERYH